MKGSNAEQYTVEDIRTAHDVFHDSFSVHLDLHLREPGGLDGVGRIQIDGANHAADRDVWFSELMFTFLVPSTTRLPFSRTCVTRAETVVVRVV